MLVACSNPSNDTKESKANKDNGSDKTKTVEITDAHGTVKVPVKPKECSCFG